MITIQTTCKRCGVVHTTKGPSFFRNTLRAWSDIPGFIHPIRHHWKSLTRKARLWAPFYAAFLPVRLILALAWDALRAALLIATWPFWWLHEEVF